MSDDNGQRHEPTTAPQAPSVSATPAPLAFRRKRHLPMRISCGVLVGLVLVVFVLCNGLEVAFHASTQPTMFLVANVLAFLTAVPYALTLLWLDRNEKEPLYLVATAVLWGAVVATFVSGLFNSGFRAVVEDTLFHPQLASMLSAQFSAPFIEELTKGLAVLFIFVLFRDEFDGILDGILYGALVGLGFATIENIGYYTRTGAAQGLEGMLELTWIRGVLNGLAGHATYTAITGCGFAMARMGRSGFARWLYVPMFWFTAMLMHFLWNKFCGVFALTDDTLVTLTVTYPLTVLVLHAPFTGLLAITVAFVWKQENQVILTYLMGEKDDVVTGEYRQALVPARRRIPAGLRRLFTRGPRFWWHHRKLQYELIELAFAKWHLDEDPRVHWSADEDQGIQQLRDVVRRRWGRLAALSPGPR